MIETCENSLLPFDRWERPSPSRPGNVSMMSGPYETDPDGLLERSESTVRLSELGTERIDEVLRKLADRVATLLNGVPAEQLALLRHVSLRLILNHQMP